MITIFDIFCKYRYFFFVGLGCFCLYMNFNFYKEHQTFFIYTPNKNYKATIFSVYVDDTESDSYNQKFKSHDDYKKYIDRGLKEYRDFCILERFFEEWFLKYKDKLYNLRELYKLKRPSGEI